MYTVNKWKNFFKKHKQYAPIPRLFTARSRCFFKLADFDDVANWPEGDVSEEKECEEEFFKKEGNAKAKD